MAIETTEMQLTRLERACDRIAERMSLIERRLTAIEPRLASGVTSLRYEVLSGLDALRAEVRTREGRLRKQGLTLFYWLLALVAGSALVSLLLERVP